MTIFIDADAQIDLIFSRIGLEGGLYAKDRIGRSKGAFSKNWVIVFILL